jgi:hypothetical protein
VTGIEPATSGFECGPSQTFHTTIACLRISATDDDRCLAIRRRPTVRITRPVPPAGDCYELREIATDKVSPAFESLLTRLQ